MGMLLALALASGLLPSLALADAISDSQLQFQMQPISSKRCDPVDRPGNATLPCAAYSIFGANNIHSSSTSDQLRGASCTSSPTGIDVDASTFGVLQLYNQHPNGTFSAVKINGLSLTYTMYSPGVALSAWPKNFAMSVGDLRAYDPLCGSPGHTLPHDDVFYGDSGNSPTLAQYAGGQMGWGLHFPDCWDGKPFGRFNQSDHLTWSNNYKCDAAHPIKFPQMTIEAYFHITDIPASSNFENFVLANGDPYGCSNHGWAVMAWQEGVMESIIKDCSNLGHGNSANCPHLGLTSDNADISTTCQAMGKIPAEDTGFITPVAQMPGCNLVEKRAGKPCLFNVGMTEPLGYASQGRSGLGGIPWWNAKQATLRSISAVATSNPWNMWLCRNVMFGGDCKSISYKLNTCFTFDNVGGEVFSEAFESAGTEDDALCTLYTNSDCTGTSHQLTQGGDDHLGALENKAKSAKCSQR